MYITIMYVNKRLHLPLKHYEVEARIATKGTKSGTNGYIVAT